MFGDALMRTADTTAGTASSAIGPSFTCCSSTTIAASRDGSDRL